MAACPKCGSDDLDLAEKLENGQRRIKCESCGHDWLKGEPRITYLPANDIGSAWGRFPKAEDVRAEVLQEAQALKKQFLEAHPGPREEATEFREQFEYLFSQQGLREITPEEIRYFANANRAGNPGNMSVFNNTWNEMGPGAGTREVKAVIEYLLYGHEETPREDRLTDLITGRNGLGMNGFREALLTKVLCMVEPDRFIPINMYTGQGGKKEIAKWVYDLELPRREKTAQTIGRLIVWSNDLLLKLAGDGFVDNEHVAEFLWWAKDEVGHRKGLVPTADPGDEPEFVLFKDDDEGFRNWLREHARGFYLNAARNPSGDEVLLHQVGCTHVGDASPGGKWTETFIKVCSASKTELEAWSRTTAGQEPRQCQSCA